jgi:predicted nuclease with TOPRIM domain
MTTDARLSEEDEKRLAAWRNALETRSPDPLGYLNELRFLIYYIDALKKPCAECEKLIPQHTELLTNYSKLLTLLETERAECERLRAENAKLEARWTELKDRYRGVIKDWEHLLFDYRADGDMESAKVVEQELSFTRDKLREMQQLESTEGK